MNRFKVVSSWFFFHGENEIDVFTHDRDYTKFGGRVCARERGQDWGVKRYT